MQGQMESESAIGHALRHPGDELDAAIAQLFDLPLVLAGELLVNRPGHVRSGNLGSAPLHLLSKK